MSFPPSQQYPQYQQQIQAVQYLPYPPTQGQGQQFVILASAGQCPTSSSQPLPPAPYSQVHHGLSDHPPMNRPPSSLLFPAELFNPSVSHQSHVAQSQLHSHSHVGYQHQQSLASQQRSQQPERSSSFSIPKPDTAALSLSLSSAGPPQPQASSVYEHRYHQSQRIPPSSPATLDRPTGTSTTVSSPANEAPTLASSYLDDLAGLFGPMTPAAAQAPVSAGAPPTATPLATQDLLPSLHYHASPSRATLHEQPSQPQEPPVTSSAATANDKDTAEEHPFPFACPMVSCHRRYKSIKALKKHIVDHANALTADAEDPEVNVTVEADDLTPTSTGVAAAAALDSLAARTCSRCGRVFKRKSDCVRHERSHTNERPFACGTCNKRWTRKEGLTKHLRESVSCRAAEELRVNGLHSGSPSSTLISPLSQSPSITSTSSGSPASMSPPVITRRASATSKLFSPPHDHLAPPTSSLSGSVPTSRAMPLPSPLATPPAVSRALPSEYPARESGAPEPDDPQSTATTASPSSLGPPEPTAAGAAGGQQSNLLSRRMMRRPASMMHDASFMIVPPQPQPATTAKIDDAQPSPGVARLANLRIHRTESLDLSTTDLSALSASPRPPTARDIQQPPAKRHAGSRSAAVNVPGGHGWMGDMGAPEQAQALATSPRSRGLARHVFADFTHVPYGANPAGVAAATSQSAVSPSTATTASTTTTARGTKRPASWSLQSTADALLRETLSRPEDSGAAADVPPPMGSRREMLDFPLLHMMGGVPHGFGESGFRHSFVGVAPVPSASESKPAVTVAALGADPWMVDADGNPVFGANMSSSAATLAGGVPSHISLPSLTNLSMLSQSSPAPAGPAAAGVQPTPPLSASSSEIKSPSSFMSFSPNLGGAGEVIASGSGARRSAGNLVRIPSHLSYASSLIASPTLDSFEGAAAVALASVAGLQQQQQQVHMFDQQQPQPAQYAQPPQQAQHVPMGQGQGQPTMLKLQPILNPDGSTTIRLPPGFVLAPGPPPAQQPPADHIGGGSSSKQQQFAPAAVPQFVVLPQPQQVQPGQAQQQQGDGPDLSSWTQVVPGLTQVGMMTPQNGAYLLR